LSIQNVEENDEPNDLFNFSSFDKIDKFLSSILGTKTQSENNADEVYERLSEGRKYLMGVETDDLNVEDCLEAFGFGRNGL